MSDNRKTLQKQYAKIARKMHTCKYEERRKLQSTLNILYHRLHS